MRDATADYDFLILPGLGNSGVDHWQSYWSLAFRNASRVLQDEWDNPELAPWLSRLDAAIAGGTRPAVLICHSLSCSLAAHWAARNKKGRVVAAFLVAPSDVESDDHTPESTRDFAPIPRAPFPVPLGRGREHQRPLRHASSARSPSRKAGARIYATPANSATSIRNRSSASGRKAW